MSRISDAPVAPASAANAAGSDARPEPPRTATPSGEASRASASTSAPPTPAPATAGSSGPNPALASVGTRFSIPPAAGVTISVPPGGQSASTVIQIPPRRTLLYYSLIAGGCFLIYVFRQTITLAFTAFAIAYVFAPIVRRVSRYGVPRPLAILVVLFTGTAVVAGTMSILLPELVRQADTFVKSIPSYSAEISRSWIPVLRNRWHIPVPSLDQGLSELGGHASSMVSSVGSLLSGTLVAVEYAFKALIVFALTFYLLLEFETVLGSTYELVPHRARTRVHAVAHEIDDTLRHFVTGQLVVMFVLGALYALGLTIVRVPSGWAIGVFAGLISFVPYLGFFVALGLAVFMSALQGNGAGLLVAVAAVMTAVHILDLTLITPRILGGRAKISPVVTILALIAGGSVFGFVGVLVAIPAASVMKVLLRELVNYYKTTTFFTAGESLPGAFAAVRAESTSSASTAPSDPGVSLTPTVVARAAESTLPFGIPRESK